MSRFKLTPYVIWFLIKGAQDRSHSVHFLMVCGFTEPEAQEIVARFYDTPQTAEGAYDFSEFVKPYLDETEPLTPIEEVLKQIKEDFPVGMKLIRKSRYPLDDKTFVVEGVESFKISGVSNKTIIYGRKVIWKDGVFLYEKLNQQSNG